MQLLNYFSLKVFCKNRKIFKVKKRQLLMKSVVKIHICKPKTPFNVTFNSNLNKKKTVFTDIFHIIDQQRYYSFA